MFMIYALLAFVSDFARAEIDICSSYFTPLGVEVPKFLSQCSRKIPFVVMILHESTCKISGFCVQRFALCVDLDSQSPYFFMFLHDFQRFGYKFKVERKAAALSCITFKNVNAEYCCLIAVTDSLVWQSHGQSCIRFA